MPCGGRDVIPLARPDLGVAEEQAVLDVLRSGVLAMGPRCRELEDAWAARCGVRHAVYLANGTLGLEALLQGLGIGPGDEVITVAFTFNATISAILRVGATPVLVDVNEDDHDMDVRAAEAAVTHRTRAILPVHLYGLMADMAPLQALAARHGLALVEDAAQAVGASYRGRAAGSFGPAMFSLYATKSITSGEGGMVTTDDDRLASAVRRSRDQGMTERYRHDHLGTNLRPTEISAAIGLVQLQRLDSILERRRDHAGRLTAALGQVQVPSVPDGRVHAWHQYTIRLPGRRDAVATRLAALGVGTGVYYRTPVHRQPYLREHAPSAAAASLPVTERLADEVLSLPVRANLSREELGAVIDAVLAATT